MEDMIVNSKGWSRVRSVLVMLTVVAGAGFNQAFAQNATAPVVLVHGDSLSAAYGLPAGRGWVDLLREKMMREAPGFKVVNASISGETTLGGRNRLAALLAQHRPAVVILELGANDGMRGAALDGVRDNLSAMTAASRTAGAQVLILGMRLPPNYGAEYGRRFHALFGEVAHTQRAAWVPFLFEGFGDRRDLFQDDGIHPVASAQPRMLDTVWPALEPLLRKARARAGLLLPVPGA
ncbi:MAG: arylesterase [Rhodocyclaceae bacterium]|nr:arylesterase [Rhodocyclaceae bacterium]MCA3141154.1 arylesterase [Rhodocyclaceae bacterium]